MTGGKGGEGGERGGGYFVLNPLESLENGFEVSQVEWEQVQGPGVQCDESRCEFFFFSLANFYFVFCIYI